MPIRLAPILTRLLAEAPLDPQTPLPPGDLPTAGRAWIVLAVFGLAMALLIALLVLTIGRRSYRRYVRAPQSQGGPSHQQASPWSEAGKRAAPVEALPRDPDGFNPDAEPSA